MRRKRRHVYWLTLPMPRQDSRRQQFLAINYAIAQAARKAGSKAHVVDTVPVLSPGNRFHRRLRYHGESVVVRDGDGVHLTTDGARIVRDLVVRAMRSDGLLRRTARAAATAGMATLDYEKPLPELEIGAAYALAVEAARGQRSRIAVGEDADGYTVIDNGAPLLPGSGCSAVTAHTVRCATPRAAEDRSVFVDAGNGTDHVALPGLRLRTAAEVRGGGDADVIFGSAGADVLSGGGGGDILVGGTGIDLLDGGGGNDVIAGGPDRDAVTYQRRSQPLTVDLAGETGGARGEHDRLYGIESVIGGRAADEIRGTRGSDTLVGGEGAAHDRLVGRGGADGLIGYRAIGGRGADVLDAHRLGCGRGRDVIFRRTHSPRGPFPRTCERLIAIFVVLRPQPIRTSRHRAIFGVRCFRIGTCRGALELRDRKGVIGVIGRRHFELRRRGESDRLHEVRIRLRRHPRAATLRVTGVRAFQTSSFAVTLR
jgi:hemolysin type calcium-binding protein